MLKTRKVAAEIADNFSDSISQQRFPNNFELWLFQILFHHLAKGVLEQAVVQAILRFPIQILGLAL
jgi:hypothetical protein